MQPDCPIGINRLTGQLYTLRNLDREDKPTHVFQVKAQEEPSGMSHTLIRAVRGLLIPFPLNNTSSHEKLKPRVLKKQQCCFKTRGFREGVNVQRPKKTVCSLG